MALFCVGTASAFGWLLAYYQIPKALLEGVQAWGMGPTTTGFFIAGVFLVVGCFLLGGLWIYRSGSKYAVAQRIDQIRADDTQTTDEELQKPFFQRIVLPIGDSAARLFQTVPLPWD